MSITLVLEEIKTSPSSIIPILSILHHENHHLDQISKSNLSHLISRTLQLCRSPTTYNKWCGINIINVLIDNYTILANEGANFMTTLITILESFNHTIDDIILKSCIECLNKLIKVIRNKPTLTREILTPKLSTIVALYLKNLQYAPNLCIKSLYQIIKHHPTTFRPFANKFGEKLYTLMQDDGFIKYPSDLQSSICKALAILPVVEKNEPETKWATDVDQIIAEIKGVVEIYEEFLNFRDDSELKKLMQKLPQSHAKVFSSLEIDLNDPKTILQISCRIAVLTKLLAAYLNEGISSVKVPLGKVFVLIEMICAINTRYLSFRSDVRDEEIRSLIKTTIQVNYQSVLGLSKHLLVFKGSLIPHLPSLWSSMAYIVPMTKSGKVSSTDIWNNEPLFLDLLSCVGDYLQLTGVVADNTLLVPFVNVALILSQPRAAAPTKPKDQPASTSQQKKPKKKNVSSAPLSDILSHEHLFTQSRSKRSIEVVRTFIDQIVKRSELSPTQHYKVMKCIIQECVEAAANNYEITIPDPFRALLGSIVLNPGYDKHNVLPIISSILPNDPLLSVFVNPRLPPLPQRISATREQDVEFDDLSEPEEDAPMSTKESAIMKLIDEQREQERKHENEIIIGSTHVSDAKRVMDEGQDNDKEKKRKVETVAVDFSFKPEPFENAAKVEKIEPVVETEVATVVTTNSPTNQDNADESDFEMPEINMEDDSDDEGDE